MGHTLSDQAGNAVKKSEKKEVKKTRTDAEVFCDIDVLLTAGLSVPPLDIRLLLTRYTELKTKSETVAVEYHATEVPATLPSHSGSVLRIVESNPVISSDSGIE